MAAYRLSEKLFLKSTPASFKLCTTVSVFCDGLYACSCPRAGAETETDIEAPHAIYLPGAETAGESACGGLDYGKVKDEMRFSFYLIEFIRF